MSNPYFAKTRQVWATKVGSGTMPAPGTDITLTTLVNPVLFNLNNSEVNPNTNIITHSIGIFSNFADGLVKTTAGYQYVVTVRLTAFEVDERYTDPAISGGTTFTTTGGTTTITGVGTNFASYLVDDDYFTDGQFVYNAASVVSNTAITGRDLNPENRPISLGATGTIDRLIGTSDDSRTISIENLNEWVPFDEFLLSGKVANPYVLGLEVLLRTNRNDIGTPNRLIDYHTDSVNSGFTGDEVYLNVGLNYEYTARAL